MKRVCVAVPTFRRPVQLAGLLRRLALQDIDSSQYDLRFVVIDNDTTPAAELIVRDARVLFKHPLSYMHMPEPGLSAVRNAALNYAAAEDDFLAMIDDDEVPELTWLAELLRVQALTNADAVIGPVPTRLPPCTPTWVKTGNFFDRPRFKDCAELDFGITGNCLLALSTTTSMRLEFDAAFGLSGGEDTVFFRQMLAKGAKIVYAARAVAIEYVPLSRTTLRYIAAREFRKGNAYTLCELQMHWTLRSACGQLFKGLLLMGLTVCLLPTRIVLHGYAGAVKSVCEASRAAGRLAGVAGYRFLGYARRNDLRG
jgi:succinoglycan biosynthesis protein ExoM